MGWDAFGLPAENYAIKMGVHPRVTTERNIANYHRQMDLIGLSFDWAREITSCFPDYYRWTQWFFLLLYERGLAYRATGQQWWCPSCKTVLANEQVEQGSCWRCGSEVTKKDLEQWYFRITDYAQRLLDDLETIDWPEQIKLMQTNWIGRSEGAEVDFGAAGPRRRRSRSSPPGPTRSSAPRSWCWRRSIRWSTSSPTPEQRAAVERLPGPGAARERDRAPEHREGEDGRLHRRLRRQPGQRRADPDLDQRLRAHGLRHRRHHGRAGARRARLRSSRPSSSSRSSRSSRRSRARRAPSTEAYTGDGVMVNSARFDGMAAPGEAFEAIVAWLGERGAARKKVNFKLRDWLISRQRYWGAPIPIVYCETCGRCRCPVDQLPVLLPDLEDFQPTDDGRSPLARAEEWVHTTCPRCGGPARRETDTMDTFACSTWYHFRFASPHDETAAFDRDKADYWLPVDLYVGGAEHAVMHLLYARFFCKVAHDAGYLASASPTRACATRA